MNWIPKHTLFAEYANVVKAHPMDGAEHDDVIEECRKRAAEKQKLVILEWNGKEELIDPAR